MSIKELSQIIDQKFPFVRYTQNTNNNLEYLQIENDKFELSPIKIFFESDEFTVDFGGLTHFHQEDIEVLEITLECLFNDDLVISLSNQNRSSSFYFFHDNEKIHINSYDPTKYRYFQWSGEYIQI